MIFRKPKKILKETDSVFIKLLDVVPYGLSRSQTKEMLSEYLLFEEGDPFSKGKENYRSDNYALDGYVPRPSLRVLYDGDFPFSSFTYLVYPLNIVQLLAKVHRNQIFAKLNKLFDSKFGRSLNEDGLTFWHKGNTLVFKNLYKEKDGRLGIKIHSANNELMPVEKILEGWRREVS